MNQNHQMNSNFDLPKKHGNQRRKDHTGDYRHIEHAFLVSTVEDSKLVLSYSVSDETSVSGNLDDGVQNDPVVAKPLSQQNASELVPNQRFEAVVFGWIEHHFDHFYVSGFSRLLGKTEVAVLVRKLKAD